MFICRPSLWRISPSCSPTRAREAPDEIIAEVTIYILIWICKAFCYTPDETIAEVTIYDLKSPHAVPLKGVPAL